MGDIADRMINGEMCSECGCYLMPNETVYSVEDEHEKYSIPDDGSSIGVPVICNDCKNYTY